MVGAGAQSEVSLQVFSALWLANIYSTSHFHRVSQLSGYLLKIPLSSGVLPLWMADMIYTKHSIFLRVSGFLTGSWARVGFLSSLVGGYRNLTSHYPQGFWLSGWRISTQHPIIPQGFWLSDWFKSASRFSQPSGWRIS